MLRRIRGFTLIELLLYLGLAASMLSVISGFLFMLLQAKIKNQTIREVEQQGIQITNLISQTIRNSQEINLPLPGRSDSQISLIMGDSDKSPTIFNLSSDAICITEGEEAPVILSSSDVKISNLVFSNLSLDNTPGTIKFQFTVSHKNEYSRQEYDYSQTFYNSASLNYP